jgi:type II secretory pathway pseudopilin PulG
VIPGLLLALVLVRVAWMARRWARAREAEAAERAVARHTLLVYAGLPDGRRADWLPRNRYGDSANTQEERRA